MTIYEYRSRCEWLAKFYAEAAATGRAMQMRCEDWVDYDIGPNMQSYPDEWRLKPEPQEALKGLMDFIGPNDPQCHNGPDCETCGLANAALTAIAKAEGRDA